MFLWGQVKHNETTEKLLEASKAAILATPLPEFTFAPYRPRRNENDAGALEQGSEDKGGEGDGTRGRGHNDDDDDGSESGRRRRHHSASESESESESDGEGEGESKGEVPQHSTAPGSMDTSAQETAATEASA